MFWQSLKIFNFFIFNTFSRFSQTTTLKPLFKFYPMLWYCLQRINSFDGLHCGLILDFQFFEANGSETSVDVRSMQSLNRTKRSASRSLRKTHVVCLLISSFKTSFSFNRQYHSLPTSALCRFGRLNWKILRQISLKTFITCATLSTDSFNKTRITGTPRMRKKNPVSIFYVK